MNRLIAVLLLALTFVSVSSFAAPPATITYQGYLTDRNNAPLNTPVAMTLSLYVNSTGGAALWSEFQDNVSVANGIYSVLMGSISPITLPFDEVYYLGVAIGSDPEMTPRQQLSAVPYTFRAAIADKLAQVCGDGEVLKYSTATSNWSCTMATGPQGPQGLTGAVGPQGPIGLTGATGAVGATGPQGSIGLTGATGATGAAGINGLNGKTVLNGVIDPTVEGVNGDFYINSASNKLFGPKAAGVWPSGVALVGPQGIQGIQGATGATGSQGPIGLTGATGAVGATGSQGATGLTGATGPEGASPFILNNSDAAYTSGSVGIGVNPPDATAALDVSSTTKGFLQPRMTTSQRNAITTPAAGMTVYDTDRKDVMVFNGTAWVTPGYTIGSLLAASNLSDLANAETARANLGLGNVTNNDTTNASNITSGTLATGRLPALTGDVTSSDGSALTTIAKVGEVTAADVAKGTAAANSATDSNTLGTIVKRDASGNFSAGTITANLNGNAATATTITGTVAGSAVFGNISSSAANVTGIVAIDHGGTGRAYGLSWLQPVYDFFSSQPVVNLPYTSTGSNNTGSTSVIVTSNWGNGNTNDIATTTDGGLTWTFAAPVSNSVVYVANVGIPYFYDGMSWKQYSATVSNSTQFGNTDRYNNAINSASLGKNTSNGSSACSIGSVWLVAGRTGDRHTMACDGSYISTNIDANYDGMTSGSYLPYFSYRNNYFLLSSLTDFYGPNQTESKDANGNLCTSDSPCVKLPDLRAATPNGLTYVICIDGISINGGYTGLP